MNLVINFSIDYFATPKDLPENRFRTQRESGARLPLAGSTATQTGDQERNRFGEHLWISCLANAEDAICYGAIPWGSEPWTAKPTEMLVLDDRHRWSEVGVFSDLTKCSWVTTPAIRPI